MNSPLEFFVPEDYDSDERLDQYLCRMMGDISRSHLKNRLSGLTVNDADTKLSKHVQKKDHILVTLNPEEVQDLISEPIDFSIIFEDENVLVINKPRNLVVHPAPGHPSGTLLNGILCHLDEDFLSDQDGSIRPGIVHRLDKDTSGLMIVAKTAYAMSFLSEQFSSRSTYKEYLAIVRGKMTTSRGIVDKNLIRDPKNRQKYTTCEDLGKNAVTDYFVEKKWPAYTLVKLVIHTGRTHQIRVHMKSLGYPVAGDPIYGKSDPAFPNLPLMLHSCVLKITLPGETEPRTFSSPIPEDMRIFMQELDKQTE